MVEYLDHGWLARRCRQLAAGGTRRLGLARWVGDELKAHLRPAGGTGAGVPPVLVLVHIDSGPERVPPEPVHIYSRCTYSKPSRSAQSQWGVRTISLQTVSDDAPYVSAVWGNTHCARHSSARPRASRS
ncbi:hypothetical protein GCM10010357_49260 [Streptomyces luteireticuli]|uniref:Transposase IS701-like DDE domain-containing protein n=1 Tax=Streptomyces luteireticuli TaxID=173858 RepID=A0ABN0YZL0_9ACTN